MLKGIENLRLMTKVVIPTVVMLAVALGIVALAEDSLRNVTAQMHEIIRVTATRQAEALVAAAAVNGVAADEKNAMLMTDKAGLDVFASAYVTDLDHLKSSIATLKGLPGNSVETERLERITRAINAYGSTGEQLYQLMVDREFEKAHALSTGAAQNARERLIGLIREEVDQSTAQMQQAETAADAQYQHTLGLLVGLSVGGLLCALVMVGWISKRFIVQPLTAITDLMGRLSEGDLTIQIAQSDRRDEIGTLERALKIFRDRSVALNDHAERLTAAHLAIQEMNGVLERRVEERTAALKDAQRELLSNERFATLGQLTATVAHELRNPLSAMRNTVFALRESISSAGLDLDRPLSRVDRNIQRCNRFITDLLEFTHMPDLHPSEIEADSWLEDVLNEQPVPDGIAVRRELGAIGHRFRFDPERLRRVVINLLDNAAQVLTDPAVQERCVTVSTIASTGCYELTIEDTGPGIPRDVLARVFEPLFSTKSFGSGLGLPTVKQIVEQHGGTVEINSHPGEGTRVLVRLPNELRKKLAA